MAGYYDIVDCIFDNNGDFMIGDDGDIADSRQDPLAGVIDYIRSIVRSNVGDWELNPSLASELTDFVGMPNTRDTGAQIESRVRTSIILGNVISASDVSVRVVPVRADTVLVLVSVRAIPTALNGLSNDGLIRIAFMLDVSLGEIVFIETEKVTNYFPVGS
jgi:hypothetical protein